MLAPTLETTISANGIFELAKTFEIQLRRSDILICARRLPANSRTSFMRPKQLWRAIGTMEVTLSDMSVAIVVLLSLAAPTTQPPTGYLLDRFARPCWIALMTPSLPRDASEAHKVCLSRRPPAAHVQGLGFWGTLAGPSALTPTSSWWALVTLQPCQAWHGWGLGGVNSGGFDPWISSCREASMRRAFISIICTQTSRPPAWIVRYFLSRLDTPRKLSCPRAGPLSDELFGGRRVRADVTWYMALELAAYGREATPCYGIRWHSTGHVSLESPVGAMREGRGPEEGRSRRNDTVWRRRSS
jgi:hypothetical protein